MNAFITGVLCGLPLMVAVGPISLLLIQTGMLRGFVLGWPAAVGVAAADLTYATVSAVGGAGLRHLLAPISTAVPYIGGAALLVIAAGMARRALGARLADAPSASADDPSVGHRSGVRLGWQMFILTALNPMTILAFTSLVMATGQGAAMGGWPLGIGAASLTVHLLMVGVGGGVRHTISARAQSALQLVGAAAVAAIATNLLVGA